MSAKKRRLCVCVKRLSTDTTCHLLLFLTFKEQCAIRGVMPEFDRCALIVLCRKKRYPMYGFRILLPSWSESLIRHRNMQLTGLDFHSIRNTNKALVDRLCSMNLRGDGPLVLTEEAKKRRFQPILTGVMQWMTYDDLGYAEIKTNVGGQSIVARVFKANTLHETLEGRHNTSLTNLMQCQKMFVNMVQKKYWHEGHTVYEKDPRYHSLVQRCYIWGCITKYGRRIQLDKFKDSVQRVVHCFFVLFFCGEYFINN